MHSNARRTQTLVRMIAATVIAVSINATMIGGLLSAPTIGETMLLASRTIAAPMTAGVAALRSLKADAAVSMTHGGRDLRHAERDLLRGLHHDVRAAGATLGLLVTPLNTTC